MKISINREEFVQLFNTYGRENQFSPLGRRKLFDYLEEYEESTGESLDIDIIALCCDYSEISITDIQRETGCESLDDLRDSTTVIEVDDETIIYGSF